MTSHIHSQLPDHRQRVYEAAPELLTRKALSALSCGTFAVGTIANRDSEGSGPQGRCIVGKRTCYPKLEAMLWLAAQEKAV